MPFSFLLPSSHLLILLKLLCLGLNFKVEAASQSGTSLCPFYKRGNTLTQWFIGPLTQEGIQRDPFALLPTECVECRYYCGASKFYKSDSQ